MTRMLMTDEFSKYLQRTCVIHWPRYSTAHLMLVEARFKPEGPRWSQYGGVSIVSNFLPQRQARHLTLPACDECVR
jgi:hypothetical protein